MAPVRMAQYGTRHGHAAGKVLAMRESPAVEFAGVYERDPDRRRALTRGDDPAYRGVHWFESEHDLLDDPSIVAVASEGRNAESLAQTEAIVHAGKHVWYDKPAGDNWSRWQRVVSLARLKGIYLQMGYMFRYHEGFARIANWAREGFLGEVFAVRAHMSTHITAAQRQVIGTHRGGIQFDLAGHMLDQIVWMLGRPSKVTSFRCHHDGEVAPGFDDNTLAVLEYDGALAMVDIAAMETPPMARRLEVYGRRGSAILLEPFEPAEAIRLCLDAPRGGFVVGAQIVPVTAQSRQALYDRELEAFLGALDGSRPPDRTLDHELLVQETLLRCTGAL